MIMLLTLSTICTAAEYPPLTDVEIDGYLKSITLQELREDIRRLDILEHTTPVIPFPGYIAILTKRDLYLYPRTEIITVQHGHLTWNVTLPESTIEDFIPPVLSAGASFGIGCAAGAVIILAAIAVKNIVAR